jgi:hypothetical protein
MFQAGSFLRFLSIGIGIFLIPAGSKFALAQSSQLRNDNQMVNCHVNEALIIRSSKIKCSAMMRQARIESESDNKFIKNMKNLSPPLEEATEDDVVGCGVAGRSIKTTHASCQRLMDVYRSYVDKNKSSYRDIYNSQELQPSKFRGNSSYVKGDSFRYDPLQSSRNQVRATLVESAYRCISAVVFADINGGARKKSLIRRDRRLIGCFAIVQNSKWFGDGEKSSIFNYMIDRSINEVISGRVPMGR